MNAQLAPIEDIQDKAAVARSGLTHIHIGFNTVVRVTRERPERERRALRWLGQYIIVEKRTTDEVCRDLRVDVPAIRSALTNPDADVRQLLPKIESLRSIYEANLRQPVETDFIRAGMKAFRFAGKHGALTEFIDLTRTGKSTLSEWMHRTNLDRAIYVDCTSGESYASFITSVARGCGISIGEGKKGKGPERIEEQIESIFAAGGMDLLILDEAHYLWPTNIKLKPKRIEYVRKLWDRLKRTVATVLLSTPQSVFASNQSLQRNKRWSPGQWEGRITRFYPPETVSDADVRKVVKWHCPDGDERVLDGLCAYTRSTPGFYGAMENVLRMAREEADDEGVKLQARHIAIAIKDATRNTKLGLQIQKGGK